MTAIGLSLLGLEEEVKDFCVVAWEEVMCHLCPRTPVTHLPGLCALKYQGRGNKKYDHAAI